MIQTYCACDKELIIKVNDARAEAKLTISATLVFVEMGFCGTTISAPGKTLG